ncbi:hypothetical protein RI367_000085 [Sorochytrium milnesiophthora]
MRPKRLWLLLHVALAVYYPLSRSKSLVPAAHRKPIMGILTRFLCPCEDSALHPSALAQQVHPALRYVVACYPAVTLVLLFVVAVARAHWQASSVVVAPAHVVDEGTGGAADGKDTVELAAQVNEAVQATPRANDIATKPATLYVCTKCRRRGDPVELCDPVPEATANGVNGADAGKINKKQKKEKKAEDKEEPRTGQILYENLRDDPELAKLVAQGQLLVKPVKCLAACDLGNAIAYKHDSKFSYVFGTMKENSPEDIEDIVTFTKFYTAPGDAFSKSKTRPGRLRKTGLARIPPLEGEGAERLTGEMKEEDSAPPAVPLTNGIH